MKPFDIKLAKQGRKVQTKDGRPARIVCYDVKGNAFKSILTLVDDGKYEFPVFHNGDGIAFDEKSDLNLVMAPAKGWINIYGRRCSDIYDTEEEAVKECEKGGITRKIEWDE